MFAENLKQATSFPLHRAFHPMGITLSHLNLQKNKPHPLLIKRQSWKHCIPHEMIFLDYNKSVKMLSPPRIIGREAKRLSVSYIHTSSREYQNFSINVKGTSTLLHIPKTFLSIVPSNSKLYIYIHTHTNNQQVLKSGHLSNELYTLV